MKKKKFVTIWQLLTCLIPSMCQVLGGAILMNNGPKTILSQPYLKPPRGRDLECLRTKPAQTSFPKPWKQNASRNHDPKMISKW